MWPFKSKNEGSKENEKQTKTAQDTFSVNEKPRICCIDIEGDIIEDLRNQGHNIFDGTLGEKVSVPNSRRNDKHPVLLNYSLPTNLHEYDIFIIDLDSFKKIDYTASEHVRKEHTGKKAFSLLSSYPETIFDPRPIVCSVLGDEFRMMSNKPLITIVFTTGNYFVEYESVEILEDFVQRQPTFRHGIYSFFRNCPLSDARTGKDMIVCDIREDLKRLLTNLIPESIYNQTFDHPTKFENGKNEYRKDWIPLIKNPNDDIVSICNCSENSMTYFLPQLKDKQKFLSDFLGKIAPEIFPELFPSSTTFSWKKQQEYWLPDFSKLIDEKKAIENDFKRKIEEIEIKINANNKKYSFLHEIITETGNSLTSAVIKFFKWLGFKEVIDFDREETKSGIKEEDIQIPLSNGLLIIECKGIGGTSTDADCNQISKIKHRRCKERNKFDVFALYLVNHQRYLPPLNRQNPPFSKNQIEDAINDERGLATTWQLYNLFFDIENGVISKLEAQKAILEYGLINFRPNNLIFIYEPNEILKNGFVCIVNIDGVQLEIGEKIIVEKNERFQLVTLEGIQIENKPVSNVICGEVGLSFDQPIPKKSRLWKRKNS